MTIQRPLGDDVAPIQSDGFGFNLQQRVLVRALPDEFKENINHPKFLQRIGDQKDKKEELHPEARQKIAKQRGWTKESHRDYWKKISRAMNLASRVVYRGEPGGHTACVERMRGKVDDPHAFCAWAEHEATGYWPREKRD